MGRGPLAVQLCFDTPPLSPTEQHIYSLTAPRIDLSRFNGFQNLWKGLRRTKLHPRKPLLSPLALYLNIQLTWTVSGITHSMFSRALVDTGAAFPILVNRGLIPSEHFQKCRRPYRFVSASGETLEGGQNGLLMAVSLPVSDDRNVRNGGGSLLPPVALSGQLKFSYRSLLM